jgi:hypothetical protein
MRKEIILSGGYVAIVDDEDFEYINQFKWHYRNGYAQSSIKQNDGSYKNIRMHRLIMNAEKGILVDHHDGNKLNNQKSNLRLCNDNQNQHNRKSNKNSSSIHKGVSKMEDGRFRVRINSNGKSYFLGLYEDENIASNTYNHKALELHGEFAKLNEVEKYVSKEDCEKMRIRGK